ncbi:MAG: sodium:proton antiporter, partial [Bacteroidales bacterium]
MKKPSALLSIIPVLVLVLILIAGVQMFGNGLTAGPSQIALITASVVGALIGIFYLKIPWDKLEAGIIENLGKT